MGLTPAFLRERVECFLEMRQVRDDDLCCGEVMAFVLAGRHSDAEAAAFVRAGDIDRRVADGDRALCRPVTRSFARERKELVALIALAAESPLAAREVTVEPEAFHARVGDGRRVSRQQRRALERFDRIVRPGGDFPVARVGSGEQGDVPLREDLAPPAQSRVDDGSTETGRRERATYVCGRGVAGYIGRFRRRAVDLGQRELARLDVGVVVREQQRAVDVEEDEQAHSESSASRSDRTYARSAFGPSCATSTAREPTTMPSASSATARA